MRIILLPTNKTDILSMSSAINESQFPYIHGNLVNFTVELLKLSISDDVDVLVYKSLNTEGNNFTVFNSVQEIPDLAQNKDRDFTILCDGMSIPTAQFNTELIESCTKEYPGVVFMGGSGELYGYISPDELINCSEPTPDEITLVNTLDRADFLNFTKMTVGFFVPVMDNASLIEQSQRVVIYGRVYSSMVQYDNVTIRGDNYLDGSYLQNSSVNAPSLIIKSQLVNCDVFNSIIIDSYISGNSEKERITLENCIVIGGRVIGNFSFKNSELLRGTKLH